jgi:hypothetical protein
MAFFFVAYFPEDGHKRPNMLGGLPCPYITVSNNSTDVQIYMVICLAAWNMDNFNYSYILNENNLTS